MSASVEASVLEPTGRHSSAAMSTVCPGVIWITGLSGVGKSTLSRELARRLNSPTLSYVLLDGDEVRQAISDPYVGHDRESRLANAMRICRWAQLLSKQGFGVVVATMSLFKEVHAWNRQHLPNYFEVWIQVPWAELQARDPRSLYSRAARHEVDHVVGVDLEFDPPSQAHLILANEGTLEDMRHRVDQLLSALPQPHLKSKLSNSP